MPPVAGLTMTLFHEVIAPGHQAGQDGVDNLLNDLRAASIRALRESQLASAIGVADLTISGTAVSDLPVSNLT